MQSEKTSARSARNDGQDYIDLVSSHFKLGSDAPAPTPILRPSTREREGKRRESTERVRFNEPVEPYVPQGMREDDTKPRATLHEVGEGEERKTGPHRSNVTNTPSFAPRFARRSTRPTRE